MQGPTQPPRPPVDDGEVFGFTSSDAARVASATQYVERFYRGGSPKGRRRADPSLVPAWIAKTTTSVSARSGAAYGTGTIQIQYDNGGSLANDTDRPTVTARNLTDKVIASGSYVVVVWAQSGWWIVTVGSCSNLS